MRVNNWRSLRSLGFVVLVSASACWAEEIRTVLAEGIGTDPQSAAQNAAQNALTNVVGSFIDANKQLEKRTEIADGIRSQIAKIKTEIREYSQGSIQSIEIVETKRDGSFYRVTAKIAVRVEDFRAYIKKLAEGEAPVSVGLYAQMSTTQKQGESLAQLLAERMLSIINGEVVTFSVGKPIPFRQSKFSDPERYPRKPETDDIRFLSQRSGPDSLICFAVTAKLDDAFFHNLIQTLDSVAASKKPFTVNPYTGLFLERQFTVPVMERADSRTGTIYRFADFDHELKQYLPWRNPDSYGSYAQWLRFNAPQLEISLLDKEGVVLQVETVGRPANRSQAAVEGFQPWVLYRRDDGSNGQSGVVVGQNTFNILIAVEEEALKRAARIKVKLVK